MAKKTRKPKRELVGGLITHLSFVDRGANMVRPILKAKGNQDVEVIAQITKFDPQEHLLYSLVYGPEVIDSHGDFAKAEVVKHYCHNFLRPGGGNIDTMHNLINVDGVHVAENVIVQKGDRRFDTLDYEGNQVDTEGWWGVILKIENEEIEKKCVSGEFGGISMWGRRGIVRPVDTKDFTSALACRLGDNNKKEIDMDEKVLAELLAAAFKPMHETLANIQKSLTQEPKPESKKPEAAVVKFEGDPTDLDAIAKHEEQVFLASCDLATPAGIAKWKTYLEAKKAPKDEVTVDLSKAEKDLSTAKAALAASEKKVAELRKASTQKTGDEINGQETVLEKRQRIRTTAREFAKKHNESLGRK